MTAYQIQPRYRRLSMRRTAPILGLCLLSAVAASSVTRIWTLNELAATNPEAPARVADPAPAAPVASEAPRVMLDGRVFDATLGRMVYVIRGLRYGGTPNGGP